MNIQSYDYLLTHLNNYTLFKSSREANTLYEQ